MSSRPISDQAQNPPFTQSTTETRGGRDGNGTAVVAEPPTAITVQRPSAGWLRNPAWIDGGVNPPRYYYSHEEIEAACHAAGVEPPPRYTAPENTVTPAQLAHDINIALGAPAMSLATQYDILSSRVSPTPIPTNGHYRAVEGMGGVVGSESRVAASDGPPVDGHLVNVTHIFTAAAEPTRPVRNARTPPKKKQTMLGHITLETITRVDFIKAFLTLHSLHTQYAPGIHSGPAFKLSWTGSTGGKGNAPTFMTDENFNIALAAILKKDKKKIQITVEFDTDTMSGYRIQQPIGLSTGPANNEEEELVYGNRIPQVAQFNDAEQVNGRFVLELKKRWPCATHQGEHGEPGHCYITPSGGHLWLNPLRLKMWAAAIASGDVTKHDPPSTEAFDGPRDGRISSIKPRGRSGPNADATAPPVANNDMMALLMASLIPVISGLSRKRSRSESPRRHASTSKQQPPTPKRPCHVFQTPNRNQPELQTPRRLRRDVLTPRRDQPEFPSPKRTHLELQSPAPPPSVPAPGFELRACLRDFAEIEGVDMTQFEIPLRAEDYTPDIIALADESATAAIRTITGATGGRLMRLKIFCKKWQTNYERNISSGSYSTYELE